MLLKGGLPPNIPPDLYHLTGEYIRHLSITESRKLLVRIKETEQLIRATPPNKVRDIERAVLLGKFAMAENDIREKLRVERKIQSD